MLGSFVLVESILIVFIILIIVGTGVGVFLYTRNSSKSKINDLEGQLAIFKSQVNTNSLKLSFDDCNKIIDDIINDIWTNKYYLNYRLRELTIIPDMDAEINSFVKEVTTSIGSSVMLEILKYYQYNYIIKRITRKSQMLFVEYTRTFKPPTK